MVFFVMGMSSLPNISMPRVRTLWKMMFSSFGVLEGAGWFMEGNYAILNARGSACMGGARDAGKKTPHACGH